MSTLNPCFRVHIPLQLRAHEPHNIGSLEHYSDAARDKVVTDRYSDECYLPVNKIIAGAIEKTGGKFKVTYSISGATLELLMTYRPDVIESFRQLLDTGCVALLAETYHNSLSWLYSKATFRRQVKMHSDLVKDLFDYTPSVFRNTGLIHDNALASFMDGLGYKGILCEGVETILGDRSPNQVYTAPGNDDFGLLLRNASLSDDIAFRFDDAAWNEQPLTAEKYASWIHSHKDDCNITLFLDYETFGIHKKQQTGILEFLEHLPAAVLNDDNWQFCLPSEVLERNAPKAVYDVPKTISWKGREMEYCVWSENMMQNNMLKKIYSLENIVLSRNDDHTWRKWSYLQAVDHFYSMSEAGQLSITGSSTEHIFKDAVAAYKNYVNTITDFELKLIKRELAISVRQQTGNLSIY